MNNNPTNVNEQYELGLKYLDGDGVPKDVKIANYWFAKASEQGHAGAQYILGEQEVDMSIGEQFLAVSASEDNNFLMFLKNKGLEELKAINADGDTYMHNAASKGFIKSMEWMKEEKEVDVNILNKYGNMPIHCAAFAGHIKAVEWLLKNGADVNDKGQKGRTPMDQAASAGKVKMMEYLKRKDAKFDRDSGGMSPMDNAIVVSANRIESIICLKNLGMDVNASEKGKNSGKTPIFIAAELGKVEIIECLKKLGANVDKEDDNGARPIHWAIMNGQIDSVKCLVGLGANVDAEDDNEVTPMHLAAARGQIDIIEILAKKANINVENKNGITPILLAARLGQIKSMECLKNLDAELDYQRAIDFATEGGHVEAVKWLSANSTKGEN